MGVITTDKADTDRKKKELYEQYFVSKLKNLGEMEHLLKKTTYHNWLKKKKTTRNISEFITIKKIDPAVKNLTSNKSSSPDGCTGTF